MTARVTLVLALLPLCACKQGDEGHMKAILGATLIDGQGGPPVSNSVVVVSGDRIRSAGPNSAVPIPAEADRIDGSGRFLVPGLVDIYPRSDPAATFAKGNPATADHVRSRMMELSRNKSSAIHLTGVDEMEPAVAETVLETARSAGIPVFAHDWRLKDVDFLLRNGVAGLIGAFPDNEPPDHELMAKLRDLRVLVAPELEHAAPAQRQTVLRLFQAGVPLGLASAGGDPIRALELLADSGVPPLDVIVAGTHNGAVALHQDQDRGAIQPGKRADLLLLSANPGEDIRNLRKVALKMEAGEWLK